MKHHMEEEKGVLTVHITGDVDHHSAAQLRQSIDARLTESDTVHTLRLALGETDFMDSSGLGLILGRLRLARERGVRLVLAQPTPAIRKILRLAGVEKDIETEGEAV
ncbi:MAG: STAS domain-containing protein [Clostridia bacterium]|nr:STAS domain-containing protein [Clostridia bacterium]